jgi:hypothetical protein
VEYFDAYAGCLIIILVCINIFIQKEGVGEQRDKQQGGQGDEQDGFQNQNRRRRKANFGKNSVTVPGAEAAPIEIFIGNTKPLATEDLIKQVLVKAMNGMAEKLADYQGRM